MDNIRENIHAEHRQRIKARFLESGFDGFSDHEILELLLYYALPRKDTNVIGHQLLDTFGSLSGVFHAPIRELCRINGISEHTAILLKMVPQLAKVYIADCNRERATLGDYDAAGSFFVTKFIGSETEEVYTALLDNGMHLIECSRSSAGDVNSSPLSIRQLVSQALTKNASFVMIAHNHPGGTVIPSGEDLSMTRACEAALNLVGVKLTEHYIVSGNNYMGILKMRSNYN